LVVWTAVRSVLQTVVTKDDLKADPTAAGLAASLVAQRVVHLVSLTAVMWDNSRAGLKAEKTAAC